jgi:hypothetical protein
VEIAMLALTFGANGGELIEIPDIAAIEALCRPVAEDALNAGLR